MTAIKANLVALGLFIVFDFVWLGFVMKDFNMRQLADIGRIENGIFQMNYGAAAITYVLMSLAVSVFVLPRLSAKNSALKAFGFGSLLGLMIYGVFDMTNLAILKHYPLDFIAPDIAWGGIVFGLVSVLTHKITFVR